MRGREGRRWEVMGGRGGRGEVSGKAARGEEGRGREGK